MPRLRFHSLREKLQSQQCVMGCFVQIPSPQIVEILGLAGFDFAVIDGEHGSIHPETVENMIRAAASTSIVPLVRVPLCDPVAVRMPFDMGAAGVHVPQVESVAMAESAVRYAKFHPKGERGMQPYVRGASYRAEPSGEFLARANDDAAVVIHIEGRGGLADLDGIVGLDGVDVAFLGPYDLSQALGVPGQVDDPRVDAAIRQAVEKSNGRAVIGTYCDTVAAVRRRRAQGVRYLAVGIDAGLLLSSAREFAGQIRDELTR